jgi:hypothetical protein
VDGEAVSDTAKLIAQARERGDYDELFPALADALEAAEAENLRLRELVEREPGLWHLLDQPGNGG